MKSHRSRTWLLYVVGIVVVAMMGLWLVNVLLGMLFKVFLAVVVVGGAIYLFGRSNRRLDNKGSRPLGR